MKTAQAANTIKTIGEATFEKLGGDLISPIIDEAKRELGLGSFLGSGNGISSRRKEMGQKELKSAKEERAREAESVDLREEVAKLAKAPGVKTSACLESMPKKIGLLDVTRLKTI